MNKLHNYNLKIKWTGNRGSGTSAYRAYDRDHVIQSEGKTEIECSSDPLFLGDKTRYNPEELLVASLSSCHMLWYLHLCSEAGVIVTDYFDDAVGAMAETANGGGHFDEVVLYPTVTVAEESMIAKAKELHKRANELCFIANSVNFPVRHRSTCVVKEAEDI
jgi:organic hydroperoxide reductase OsmC/OhrA